MERVGLGAKWVASGLAGRLQYDCGVKAGRCGRIERGEAAC